MSRQPTKGGRVSQPATTTSASSKAGRGVQPPNRIALTLTLFTLTLLLTPFLNAEKPAPPKPFAPDRRELWVPADHLEAVLKKNPQAVLLTRTQFETLLADAEEQLLKEDPDSQPAIDNPQSAIRSVALTATPFKDAVRLVAKYTVESPATGWSELPLILDPQYLASAEVDGVAALRPLNLPSPQANPQTQSPSPQPPSASPTLLLRGPDEDAKSGTTIRHTVTLTSIVPLRQTGAGASFAITPPKAAAASLTLTIPKNAKLDSDLPFTPSADGTTATFALGGRADRTPVRIGWSSEDIAPLAEAAIFQKGRYLYSIDPVRVHADLGFVLSSSLRDLPEELDITLPNTTKILGVEGTDVLRWDADEAAGTILVTMVPGKRRATDIRILTELPAIPEGDEEAEVSLPRPEVKGIHRASGTFAIFGSPEIRVRSIGTSPLTIQSHGDIDQAILAQPGFVAGFRFPAATGDTTVRLQRLRDRFTVDLDTQVTLQREAIYIERTAAIVPAEGELFETKITLPAGEEVTSVLLDDGTEPEWKRDSNNAGAAKPLEGGAPSPPKSPDPISHPPAPKSDTITVTWREGLRVGTKRTLKIRTRRDPAAWFDLDEKPLSIPFQSAIIDGAEKIAGYLAVDFGPSFQVHTVGESGLERRFAGSGEGAPVRGKLAWFRLREYDLKLDISRRPADVEAEIIAYALPLAGSLEIEGQLNLTIGLTPLRKLEVGLPPDVSEHFRLDSSLVSEKQRDPETGKWTFHFHRDLEGAQPLRFRLNIPFETKTEAKAPDPISQPPAQRSFATSAPPISLPGAKRVRGWWLVEANTDTELTFAPEGLDESDALRVPTIPGYTPRHRVIAAYQFRGADYTLAITGRRHSPETLVTTVVESLTIDSVLSTDGISRHQILLKVRSAGEQFFEVTLPAGDNGNPAELWTLAVDGIAVKPVRGRTENALRIALPDSATDGRPVLVKIVYQNVASEWNSKGARALKPPTFAEGVPVLDSSWRLHLPEGYSYRDFDSNLKPRFESKDPTLVSVVGDKIDLSRFSLVPTFGRESDSSYAQGEMPPSSSTGPAPQWQSQPGAIQIDGNSNTQDQILRRELGINPGDIYDGPTAAEREIIRGLYPIQEAEAHLATGDNALASQNYEQAIADYRAAIEKIPDAPATKSLKDHAAAKLAAATVKDARRRAESGYYDEARATLKAALEITPGNSHLNTLLSQLDDPDRFPAALTPGHVLGTQDVERLLQTGTSYYDLGDFDNAKKQFWEVLRLDRYNSAARRMLEKTEQRIVDYQNSARDHTRSKMLREVDEAWETVSPSTQQTKEGALYIQTKINTIVIPRVQFTDARIDEAIDFLRIKSKDLDVLETDPELRGINIILKADPESAPRISLDLQTIPLVEALRYVTELAGMKFKVEPYAILVVPLTDVASEIYQQTFPVPPDFLSYGSGPRTAKDILQSQGITFPEGTNAFFNPSTSQLIVSQTAKGMSLVEAMVNSIRRSRGPADPAPPTDPFASDTSNPNAFMVPQRQNPGALYIQNKHDSIVIPRVQFTDARIDEALEFLRIKSKDLDTLETDPELKGTNIILKGDPETAPRISLDLQNVPLGEALRYVTELAGMSYKVEPYAIVVAPHGTLAKETYQRTYRVPPDFLSYSDQVISGAGPVDPFAPAGGGAVSAGLRPKATSKDILQSQGITFPEGTSAFFNPATGELIVTQTKENLDLIEQFVQPIGSPAAAETAAPEPTAPQNDTTVTTSRGTSIAGLIPLDFDLPDEGVVFTFDGLFAPAELEFDFIAWEREVRVGWLWIALGAILYFFFAFDRPLFLGIFGAVCMAFLPTILWQSSTLIFNAILIGWLGAMVVRLLTRLFQKFESRRQPTQSHAW